MAFLKDLEGFGKELINQLNDQYLGENTTRSLDKGTTQYGSLGDFANKIDTTATRSYVESGYIRNVKPNSMQVMFQEPEATVLVKKRLFDSLVDNYKPELMDESEKLFIKSSKKLFQNKCQVISSYEVLTKIEKVSKNRGFLDDRLVPLMISAFDTFVNISSTLSSSLNFNGGIGSVIDTLRKIYSFSEPELTTTWINDRNLPFLTPNGEGTGIIELTLVSDLSTNVSTSFATGGGSLTIEDPYHLLFITEDDIDKAISDAVAASNISSSSTDIFFSFSLEQLSNQIKDLKTNLNSLRRNRGASEISFKVSSNTLIYKRLVSILDAVGKEIIFSYNPGVLGINASVEVDQFDLGIQVLSNQELELFKQIIIHTYQVLDMQRQMDQNEKNINIDSTIEHLREKMRLHYCSKHLIQIMDSIHVFISSKSLIDNKVQGYNSQSLTGDSNNLLSMIDTTMQNVSGMLNNFSSLFNNNEKSFTDLEKEAIVGRDFPDWLWQSLRNSITRDSSGIQVAQGIVVSVNESFNSGKYVLNVQFKDNCHYFGLSQVNIKPAVDVFNGELYNPLTPFELDYDLSTGFAADSSPPLLKENIELLNTGYVKGKNGGRLIGVPLLEQLYFIPDLNVEVNNKAIANPRKILYDPDGFVYRWKNGIGTYIWEGPRTAGAPALSNNPFAGQDVMNVLSLLITGNPYNYNNFVRSAIETANLSRYSFSGKASHSYINSLLSDLQKTNIVWGNFVPFKKIIINERGFQFLINKEQSLTDKKYQLNDLLKQRAELFDLLTKTTDGAQFAKAPVFYKKDINGSYQAPETISAGSSANQATIALISIDQKINNIQKEIAKSIGESNTGSGALQIYGDDISFDSNVTEIDSGLTEEQIKQSRIELRRKLNLLTLRRFWKVKANEDRNLFIVDDQYDKNFDIQAFERSLGKLSTFQSEYASPADHIKNVSDILGLEVFADSQGNIQARPPAYNKVPSSVFYRMLKDLKKGKRIFPKTLQSLFINQIEGIIDRIEIIEDELRLRTALLNVATDSEAEKALSGNIFNSNFTNFGSSVFKFLTLSDGIFKNIGDIRSVIQQSTPEYSSDQERKVLKSTNEIISGQLKLNTVFDPTAKIDLVNNKLVFEEESVSAANRFSTVRERLQRKLGTSVSNREQYFSTVSNKQQSEILRITNEIGIFISERQGILKLLYNAIKNIDEGLSLNSDSKSGSTLLFPESLNRKSNNIPEIIEHMIEDEETDDLGPGSSSRYIIKENQIISLSISENAPDFTAVEVNGLFGDGLAQPPTGLSLGNGGNAITSAQAVDYDLWQMYGFRIRQSVPAPYISNANTQAAPLATWLLTQQRKNIIKGSITISGNEFMQAGDVVYLDGRDLLFYVESVQHQFSYGNSFTTSMNLTFGHVPGEYIPTMLDVVGNALYSRRYQANLIEHNRFGHANGDISLTAIFINNQTSSLAKEAFLSGTNGSDNQKSLSNILYALSGGYNSDATKKPIVELRIYYNSNKNISINPFIKLAAEEIIKWISNPEKNITGSNTKTLDLKLDGRNLDNIKENIKIREIDYTNSESPSSEAWQKARDYYENNDNVLQISSSIESAIYNNIVDIWVKFEPAISTLETNKNNTNTSQAAQEKAQELTASLEK
jgi:hypothetical protein